MSDEFAERMRMPERLNEYEATLEKRLVRMLPRMTRAQRATVIEAMDFAYAAGFCEAAHTSNGLPGEADSCTRRYYQMRAKFEGRKR